MGATSGASIGTTKGKMTSLNTPRIALEWRNSSVRFGLSWLSRQESRQNGAIPDLRHPESANPDKNPDRLSGLRCHVSQDWPCRDIFRDKVSRFRGFYCLKVGIPPGIAPFWQDNIPGQRWAIRSRQAFPLLSGFRCPGAPDRATRTGVRTLCPDKGEADQT